MKRQIRLRRITVELLINIFFIHNLLFQLNNSTNWNFHMADAEPVDQKNYLEERCKPQCVKTLYDYEKCVKRVESDGSGQKHCTGQYFDYWSCVDKC
ncbi:hypothetical protein ACJX0J_016945, partial [Zea mays]